MGTALSDLKLHGSGKVREIYEDGDELVMVASDRISVYDVILPTEILDFERAAEIIGDRPLMEELRRVSIEIYERAADHAAERGIILADTKFEFGSAAGAEVVLADEVLTPDSSRFWPADDYEPGRSQASFDKQYVRDYSDSIGWDHTPPGPELPDEVVENTRAKYREAYERITERKLD